MPTPKQIFSNAAIFYFFNKTIVSHNPELSGRLLFIEDFSFDSLISKYRTFANKENAEAFYKSKESILGFTRNVFKKFEPLNYRNTFKLSLAYSDIQEFSPEFQKYFLGSNTNQESSIRINLNAAIVETDYKFILMNSDIDIIDQYEQAFSNRLFLSNISSFSLEGSEIGLGSSFNLDYTLLWDDLEELKINQDGIAYNAISGGCKVTGALLYSNGLPAYIIEQINLKIFDLNSKLLLDSITIS